MHSQRRYEGDNNDALQRKDSSVGDAFLDDCFINGDKYAESPRLSLLKRLSKCSNISKQEVRSLDHIIREIEKRERRNEVKHGGDKCSYDGDNSDEEEVTFEDEWRIVAMTVDRCLFMFFVTMFLLTSVACFSNHSFVK